MNDHPYLTAELPGIGGAIRQHLEDFQVEELPLYKPCGKGTHAYFTVAKSGVPTPVAVQRIARHMGVRPTDIGFAGLKDSQALTTQMMSLEFAQEDKLRRFRDANVKILDVSYHTNKLRMGHLSANRFTLRIRGVSQAQLPAAQAVLDVLVRRGVPNYFGEQRFGVRGDTGLLGAAIVRGDLGEFVKIFLGRATPLDPPDCRAARDAFDAGYPDRAIQRWPRHFVDQRHALIAYKRKNNPAAALGAIDKRLKRLYVSAFQSEMFNDVLVRRLDTIDRVFDGDLAQKADSGGVFRVQDASVEQARAERFEISPTGPIVGPRCNFALGTPGEIELAVLQKYGVEPDSFGRLGGLKAKGGRRPLRFPLGGPVLSAGEDSHGEFIQLDFTAPSGCYATVVLRELMKTTVATQPTALDEDDDDSQDSAE